MPVSARSACSRQQCDGHDAGTYEHSLLRKAGCTDRARQVFLEAGADDVLLNIEQLPAWIQAND
mgnify:CR=1 FL=1